MTFRLLPPPKTATAQCAGDVLRSVAQSDRALGSGPRGRGFKSRHSDQVRPAMRMAAVSTSMNVVDANDAWMLTVGKA